MSQYVEPDPKIRRVWLACMLALVAVGAALKYYLSSLPAPTGTAATALQEVADRMLLASLLNTLLWGGLAALLIWLVARAARSGQWPPTGIRMPVRSRVYAVQRPVLLWALVILSLLPVAYMVFAYWQLYWDLRGLAALVAP